MSGRGQAIVAEHTAPFGVQLRRLRLAAGLTQEELAERARLTAAGVSALERGHRRRPYPHTVLALANALGLPEAECSALLMARQSHLVVLSGGLGEGIRDRRPALNNLPRVVASFIGREHETAEVSRLLGNTAMLTLTGAGGVGKSRLALRVASNLVQAYADGVWLVELAALADASLVPHSVASALGVHEEPRRPMTDTVANWLNPRQALVLLDHCEHVIEACAVLAEVLLAACPGVSILATSREPLQIAGEIAWRVPSLSVPDLKTLPATEHLTKYASIRLFVERAASIKSGFAVTDQNARAVAQVCHQLDGISLAIELAAARVVRRDGVGAADSPLPHDLSPIRVQKRRVRAKNNPIYNPIGCRGLSPTGPARWLFGFRHPAHRRRTRSLELLSMLAPPLRISDRRRGP